jgi:hypothetical protein
MPALRPAIKRSLLYTIGLWWLLVAPSMAGEQAPTPTAIQEPVATSIPPLRIPVLSPPSLQYWDTEQFQDETHYTPATVDGHKAIKAQSHNAASGLVRKISIDLNKTPYLHWHWRVDNVLHATKEKTRQGDDYAARVYVIVSGGLFFWQTRALNYVWSSNQPVGSTWPNAFTGNAVMLAVRSGAGQTGQWLHETRNVLEDLQAYLQKPFKHIDAVAIMTDTDNSGQSATAYYGEIFFSESEFSESELSDRPIDSTVNR